MYDYSFAKYEGLFIPTVTPFDASGALDLKSLARVANYQASIPGVAGLVSCARIGEGTVVRPDEKLKVCEVMGAAAHEHGKLHTAAISEPPHFAHGSGPGGGAHVCPQRRTGQAIC